MGAGGGKTVTNEDDNKARTIKERKKRNRVSLLKRQKEIIKKENIFTNSTT